MDDLRILFMGTPVFAKEVLQSLLDNNYPVVAVVSQMDKPVGRKQILQPTPVKELALAHNIKVYQFEKIRNNLEFLDECKPTLIITCAYGQIVPNGLLSYPKYGCINVHGSLLPALRGGAPIHHALIDGYDKTGITIMDMIDKMDAGDIYTQQEVIIDDEDNLDSLNLKMIKCAKELLIKTLPDYLDGKLKRQVQDESKVTFGYNIKKEEEIIDFNKPSREVFNLIRGLSSIPCAHTVLNGKIFKIYKTKVIDSSSNKQPGLIEHDNKHLYVYCNPGKLEILEVQLEGKSKMDVKSFLNGTKEVLEKFN